MPWFTDMQAVFRALGDRTREFDWLVTEVECNTYPPEFLTGLPDLPLDRPRLFTGAALTDLLLGQPQPSQFSWGVFSALPPGTPVDLTALPVLPCADGNPDFWQNPPRIQYPGALAEIVCFDSALTLVITPDANLTHRFRTAFPTSLDLATHNAARRR